MQKYHYTGGGANRTVEEVAILKQGYKTFNPNLLKDVFKKTLGLKVVGWEVPKNVGLPHITYIVHFADHQDLVYRGNLGPTEIETQLLKEKLVSDLIKKHGLPTNSIIHVDISRKLFPFDFQIQAVLGGLDAEIEFSGTKDDYDKYSYSLGQLIAKFSDIKFEGFGHFDDNSIMAGELRGESNNFKSYVILELENQIETVKNAGYISQEVANKTLSLFEDAHNLLAIQEGSLVHYDLADHNLRYDPKSFEVVAAYDWEACVVGDSVLDIASSPTWKTIFPREEKLIEGFTSIKSLPDHYKEKINLYRLRTIIWKIVQNIKFGLVTPERMLRLKLALEPFGLKMLS